MTCEDCKEQDDCEIYQDWLNTRDCCCPYAIKEREEYYKKRELGFAGDQNSPIPIYKEDNPLYRDSVGGEVGE